MRPKLYLAFLICMGFGAVAAFGQPVEETGGSADGAVERRVIDPAPAVASTPSTSNAVEWHNLARQTMLFTGIQHAFRLGTEPGTREGMKGPFWGGYADAVGSLHGWGDGDPFLVNYIGHPMQGAVSGYLYIQNDPRARVMRFSRDPRYWRSRMKAMGFAWAYSTWFEIGPLSEASIGKIQSRRPQQGFVDHVVTPVIGTGWLVTEDFLDEKVILPFERRFNNTFARMMMRSWLNPSRSFSNALRGKVPWYRDTRGGIWARNYRAPHELELETPRTLPKAAPLELTALPIWTHYGDTQCAGGGGQAAFRLSRSWQLVAQVSGCELRDLAPNSSGDMLTYVIGPRWTPLSERRLSPYAEFLFGGSKLTRYDVDREREHVLKSEAIRKGVAVPPEEAYSQTDIYHGLALTAGTGVDIRLNPALALRLASIEYARSWARIPGSVTEGRSYNQGLQLSTGVILRMGTW